MRRYTNTTNPNLKGTTMNENTIEVKDLVTLNAKNEAITTSLKVAKVFGKEHDHVLRDIQALDCSADFRESNFGFSSFTVPGNRRSYPVCEMTRDGFTFLVMGYRGPTASKFKEEYIAAFNKMEAALRNQPPAEVPLVSLENIQKLHGVLGFTLKELERKEAVITQLETVVKKMAPKANFYDAVSNVRGNVNLTTAARTSRPSGTSTPATSWSKASNPGPPRSFACRTNPIISFLGPPRGGYPPPYPPSKAKRPGQL